MNDLQKELDAIFNLVSIIPVSGNYVETVTEIRIRLRKAFELAQTEETGKKEETDGR